MSKFALKRYYCNTQQRRIEQQELGRQIFTKLNASGESAIAEIAIAQFHNELMNITETQDSKKK